MGVYDDDWISRLSSLASTALLLVSIAALAAVAGYVAAGGLGAGVMLGLALFSSFGGARYAGRYVSRAVHARPLTPYEAPAVDNRSLLARVFGFVPRGGTPLHSHPATEDRVARLREMAAEPGSQPVVEPQVTPIREAVRPVATPIRVMRGHRVVPGRVARRVRSRQFRFVG